MKAQRGKIIVLCLCLIFAMLIISGKASKLGTYLYVRCNYTHLESSTKINDKLYEYNVLIKTDFAPEEYTRVYYFVGNIDGELKFIVNASFVPDELSDGLDAGAYSYGEEDSSSVIFEN